MGLFLFAGNKFRYKYKGEGTMRINRIIHKVKETSEELKQCYHGLAYEEIVCNELREGILRLEEAVNVLKNNEKAIEERNQNY